MSEADDIKEFMGLVGKGRAAQEDTVDVLFRKLKAEWANHPDFVVVRRRTFNPETGLFKVAFDIERK